MKRLFLNVFEFYIQSSIHVALSVVSLLYVFTLSQEVSADVNLIGTLFFGTITGYNFVKYATVAKLYHRSLTRSLRVIQVFSLISFLLMCFCAIKLPLRTLFVFGLIGFLTFLYAVPLIASKNMRSMSGVKIYVVAICWSLAVVVVPTIYYNLEFTKSIIVKIIQIILLVVALIIPFDIRDTVYDLKYLKTIPQQLGMVKAKIIAFILMTTFYGLELYTGDWVNSLVLLPTYLLVNMLVISMPIKTNRYYCSFWVESMPITYVLTIIISRFV